jgi:hypothetical protein
MESARKSAPRIDIDQLAAQVSLRTDLDMIVGGTDQSWREASMSGELDGPQGLPCGGGSMAGLTGGR